MSAALALLAAIVYGAADFCGGLASKRSAAFAVVIASQSVGLALLGATIAFVPGTLAPAHVVWGAIAGVAGGGAILMLYRALAIGTMGIVSPLTAVLAAIVPVAFAASNGDRPSLTTTFGIALALLAVIFISTTRGSGMRQRRGMPEALGAGIAFGIFFIALAQSGTADGLWPLLAARCASVAVFAIVAIGGGTLRRAVPLRADWPLIAGAGALDMGANVLYVLAVQRGSLAIAAVLTSLYPLSTVVLAGIVLRERLTPLQWAGVATALTGVACITSGQ